MLGQSQYAVLVDNNRGAYPSWIGFIFIFNLIVGTGALTLPAVFVKAGWLLSLIVIMLLAIISYMTATFVIEAMACANAVRNWRALQVLKHNYNFRNLDEGGGAVNDNRNSDDIDDITPLLADQIYDSHNRITNASVAALSRAESRLESLATTSNYYKLDDKFELGEMVTFFFNDVGRILFYICIALYLYGDLCIYSAAVAKSLRDITCDVQNITEPSNYTNIQFSIVSLNDVANASIASCWSKYKFSRFNIYRLFLIGFTLILGPFVAFSIQKTKYLQLLTVVNRWFAFTFMICIAIKILDTDGAQGHPRVMNIYGLPPLFGACVYSFMCHHSLPGLLEPIRSKLRIHTILSYDYMLICSFYVLLAITGIFAFAHVEDLYTLNFIPKNGEEKNFSILIVIDYFLALFPVLTLSASYPIIAITLRNNLQSLFLDTTSLGRYNYFIRHILFPICVILPPFLVTYFTENLTSLVAFTGSYAGVGVQYIIPVCLVYSARSTCRELLGTGVTNVYKSQFNNVSWLIFVLFWALACMCLVTINLFVGKNNV